MIVPGCYHLPLLINLHAPKSDRMNRLNSFLPFHRIIYACSIGTGISETWEEKANLLGATISIQMIFTSHKNETK